MPQVDSLVEPFFSWKQGPGRRFTRSSRTKHEPLLTQLAVREPV